MGANLVSQKMKTVMPGVDYQTKYQDWLDVQNGADPSANQQFDPTPRYIRNLRDLAQWVHVDALYQAYLHACLILMGQNASLDPGLPLYDSKTQAPFAQCGGPHILSLVCEVATRALKAVWYQKWFIHHRLRPEEYGGRVHNHLTGAARYPLHPDVLTSRAVTETFNKYGTYLFPTAFAEGSPTHSSYGSGHATVAGACVTALKAFFDENDTVKNPMVVNADGTGLIPYEGPPLTVGGELNKVASNVANGRNGAGVHWRTDAVNSLRLGEAVTIAILEEQKLTYNDNVEMTLTKFDGTKITITKAGAMSVGAISTPTGGILTSTTPVWVRGHLEPRPCVVRVFLVARAGQPVERAGDEIVLQEVVPADHDVVEHGHVVEQREILERAADAERRARIRLQAGDVAVLIEKLSFGRGITAGDAIHDRGLAGAVGADDREQFAFLDAEAHISQRAHAAEP